MMAKRVRDILAMEPPNTVEFLNTIQKHLPQLRSAITRFRKTGGFDLGLPLTIAVCAVVDFTDAMVGDSSRGGRDAAYICALDYLALLHRIKSDADKVVPRYFGWDIAVYLVFSTVRIQDQWWARLRRCRCPTCRRPYFLATSNRGHEKYCCEAHRKKAERLPWTW
jgi:hypothetical protein